MYETQTTKKGQTTIPQEIRERLGIGAGEPVVWFFEGHRAVLEPKKSVKHPIEELKKLDIKTKKSALQLKREAENGLW